MAFTISPLAPTAYNIVSSKDIPNGQSTFQERTTTAYSQRSDDFEFDPVTCTSDGQVLFSWKKYMNVANVSFVLKRARGRMRRHFRQQSCCHENNQHCWPPLAIWFESNISIDTSPHGPVTVWWHYWVRSVVKVWDLIYIAYYLTG